MRWNREHGLLKFVVSYPVAIQNPVGRLLPRRELANPAYVIERLNMFLEMLVAEYRNSHVLDLDKVTSAHGKMYVQGEGISVIAPDAFWPLSRLDESRIELPAPMSKHLRWSPARSAI